MPTFDISRVAFDPRKHYASVRMQQGRVLTDDDWNEKARIEEEEQRRTQVDVIGGYGTPNQGFKIFPKAVITTGGFIDFNIHRGVIYLGGIRFEMDADETFRLQKDWLQKKDGDYLVPLKAQLDTLPDKQRYDLVYLEGWQQPVSAVEDKSLFEEALGGPDTTTRVRNMRRVNIFPNCDSPECPIAWQKLKTTWEGEHKGKIKKYELIPDSRLIVSFTDDGIADDLCSPSVAGGYLGAENQAIRVQKTTTDHFTWGFDDAAPFYRVTLGSDGVSTIVTMITKPKDQHHWPQSGQVIELLPWSAVLPNKENISEHGGKFSKVAISYDPDTKQFSLSNPIAPLDVSITVQQYYYMRVWNRGSDLTSDAEIAIVATPIKLGDTGLQVTFTGTDSLAGDLWVIAARPETPKLIVPWELTSLTGIGPHAVRRFYAPLAIILWTIDAAGNVQGEVIHDCRKHFHPLTDQECCCTYTVGDGISSRGDFRSIQEAVDALPGEGGKICVLPGIHTANVIIDKLKKVHISGCGEQTIVRCAADSKEPIFLIRRSQNIRIDNLTMFTLKGIAVKVQDLEAEEGDPSESITIRENRILALVNAVKVSLQENDAGDNNIKILYNLMGMYDNDGGDVAIFSKADDVLIEQNRIVMILPPPDDGDDPNPDPGGDPFDPCVNLKRIYELNARFRKIVGLSLHFVSVYIAGAAAKQYTAPGGIKIGGGSEKVYILRNEIIGGNGNGITLGHSKQTDTDGEDNNNDNEIPFSTFLYDITIEKNYIREMGLSGIGAILHPDEGDKESTIHIENLQIIDNNIMLCVQGDIDEEQTRFLSDHLPASAISLAYCEDCIIRENWLEENGKTQPHPVCGIFVYFTEKIDISNNRIINNGPDVLSGEAKLNFNVRGGIVIWVAYKLPRMNDNSSGFTGLNIASFGNSNAFPVLDAVPAAKIHDNIVSQPLGHALFLIAIGPVSVVSNQFTSQGVNKREVFSTLASTVFIFNIGISKDIFNILLLPFRQWQFVNPSALLALFATQPKLMSPALILFQYWPSGKTMYTSNQVTLDLRSTEFDKCASSEIIFSLDDISFVSNQSETIGFAAFTPDGPAPFTADLVLFNTILFSISTRCNDNRFTDGFAFTFYSLLSLALMNTAIGNQSTHCLVVPFWVFRRKALNIELSVMDCDQAKLDAQWSNTKSPYFFNPSFNTATP